MPQRAVTPHPYDNMSLGRLKGLGFDLDPDGVPLRVDSASASIAYLERLRRLRLADVAGRAIDDHIQALLKTAASFKPENTRARIEGKYVVAALYGDGWLMPEIACADAVEACYRENRMYPLLEAAVTAGIYSSGTDFPKALNVLVPGSPLASLTSCTIGATARTYASREPDDDTDTDRDVDGKIKTADIALIDAFISNIKAANGIDSTAPTNYAPSPNPTEEENEMQDKLKVLKDENERLKRELEQAHNDTKAAHDAIRGLEAAVAMRDARIRSILEQSNEYEDATLTPGAPTPTPTTWSRTRHGVAVGTARSINGQMLNRLETRFGALYPEVLKGDTARAVILYLLNLALSASASYLAPFIGEKQAAMLKTFADLGLEGQAADAAAGLLDAIVPLITELVGMITQSAPAMGLVAEDAEVSLESIQAAVDALKAQQATA